jgi:ABC-type iron transport system FetAB permease component
VVQKLGIYELGEAFMNRGMILVMRLGLGLAGGFLMQRIFDLQGGWITALILAALIIAAAYLSEAWRLKKQVKDKEPPEDK